jgi:formylglycine-generating enzyme required for sulfatase activity
MTAEKKPYPLWDGKESVADYAKRVNLDPAIALDLGGGVKMEFVLIPAGKFKMGSPENEQFRDDKEGPQHDVTLGKPFYMGKYEVTQEQYEKIIKNNPSTFKGARNPVDSVSWYDAQAFCKQMSQKTGRSVRLPSEAEWEYACRAWTSTWFYNGDKDEDLGRVGWYGENSEGRTHPVGEKEPNVFGLYDMHGNVWEWVEDYWHDNYTGAPTDGSAWIETPRGGGRVWRGGSWSHSAWSCRSAFRFGRVPVSRFVFNGFRVVLLSSSPRAP